MLKVVLFDVGNVLMSWPEQAVYADIQQELGLTDEQFSLFSEKYLAKLSLGEITEEELWSGAGKEFGVRQVGADENLLGRKFAAETRVFGDILAFAEVLKARGLTVALLSNTIAPHEKIMVNKGVTKPFDRTFFSHKIGLRKPDLEIYRYVLKALHVEPSEVLFVDDLQENIEAAQKLDIRTVRAGKPETIVGDIERALRDCA